MTDKELKQSIIQAEQDAITLDYPKWSFQRRQAKLPDDHSIWQIQRDQTLARQQSENAEVRRKYLANLQAAKAEKQREYDAELDSELEPQKQKLRREWLANNPNFTATDFEKKAWIHLRKNLLEEREQAALDANIRSAKATGRYSL
jgi:hypothetical protein